MKKIIITSLFFIGIISQNCFGQLRIDSVGRVKIGDGTSTVTQFSNLSIYPSFGKRGLHINTNNSEINVGYDVTNSMPHGNVIIERGNELVINMTNNVSIKNGFECKLGGELVIKTVLEYWDY